MAERRRATRAAVAIAAAYALALHAIIAGAALGTATPSAAFAPAEYALCATDNGAANPGSPDSDARSHAHQMACCFAQVSGGILPRPSGPVLPVLVVGHVATGPHPVNELLSRRSFFPLGSRAPPRLV